MTHREKMGKTPFRQELFWDVDPKTIDRERHAHYVIERILDLGNQDDIRWMRDQYSEKQIKDVISTSRRLHKKSANFWGLMYHIPVTRIQCLRHVSRAKRTMYSKR